MQKHSKDSDKRHMFNKKRANAQIMFDVLQIIAYLTKVRWKVVPCCSSTS